MAAAGRIPLGVILVVVAAALALFGVTAGFQLLGHDAPLWLNPPNDTGVAAMGYLAILNAPWGFPPTVSGDLIAPFDLSIVYTDSIPLFALTLKALGLGHRLHLLGVFMLASWVLQALGMLALLRACGVRRPASLLMGCGLALFYPAWLTMLAGHISLGGHWILTFALAASIGAAREGLTFRRSAAFAVLAVIAVGVHVYHLVPVAACFGAALLAELLQRGRGAALRTGLAAGGFAVAVALAAWVFGYGTGRQLSGGGEALGFFSMNVLGPVLPQSSTLFGQAYVDGGFEGVIDPNGGQWYEGYNYLGAGVLALLAVGIWCALRRRPHPPFEVRRYGPLVLALIGLTLFAIGPRPYVGTWLLGDFGRPSGVIGEWLGLFRCHGRFFWTVGYALIAWAIVQLDRRLGKAALSAAAVAIIALQAYDTSGLQGSLHQLYHRRFADFYPNSFRLDPAFERRDWRIYPSFSCTAEPGNHALAAQLAFLGLWRGGSTNSAPTARRPAELNCEPEAIDLTTAPPGSRRLTVLLPDPAMSRKFVQRQDCHLFSVGYICGAGLAGVEGLTPIDMYGLFSELEHVRDISLTRGVKPPELGLGWSIPEPGGFWSDGPRATVLIPAGDFGKSARLWLELTASGFTPPDQIVEVWSAGEQRATWSLGPLARVHRAPIPAPAPGEGHAVVELRILAPARPSDRDPANPDDRLLGVAARGFGLYRDAG